MISSLVKEVMQACSLQQKGLAEVLGVSIDRVKSLTSGKVKDFTREEREALVNNLGIHPTWLITQQGPMFSHEGEDETADEFAGRIQAINRMNKLVEALPLDELDRLRLAALMSGDPKQDAPLIAEFVRRALPPEPAERVLLENYRRCNDEGKAYLVQESALVAAGLKGPPGAAAGTPAGTAAPGAPQVFNGIVSAVAGRDVKNVSVKQGKSRKNE